ncbi:hypothetical protein M5K25_020501 [Dendrobium thyrsiflorum]|uniref:Cyclin N-terminal domain-containing protein n=1 Tax=Dendrobium thyrsiflorum TaxID=117978 RepID=A0ABD0UA11_DENTH
MGVVCDHSSSILLCAEDNRSIFDLDEDVETEECFNALLEKELEHLPAADYAKRLMSGVSDISARKDAVDWIQKVRAYYSFGPLCAYLSVNYLDRFLSTHELPHGKAWMMQLLAVACLSLAIKMEEIKVPQYMDLQRMELLVLSNLKWRMQSVTPFSFMDYFLNKFTDGNPPKEPEINRCIDLILGTIKGIGFFDFRPSEVAASVAMAALVDAGLVSIVKALNCCSFVNKEKVMQCYNALQGRNLMVERLPLSSSVPQSPIGVLDASTMSYNSDETISSSQANSLNNSPATKKRKLNCTSAS